MNKVQLQYKRDTGMKARIAFKSETMKDKNKFKLRAIGLDAFPEQWIDGRKLIIPSAEYIKWLEEKVEQLTNNQ